MQAVVGSYVLGPEASIAAIDFAIDQTIEAARMVFGNKSSITRLIIDRTHNNTVVKAMVTLLEVA